MSALAQSVVISGNCGANGSNVTYVLTDDSVLTISGSGDMANYGTVKITYGNFPTTCDNTSPWGAYKDDITTVVIGENITALGDGTFAGCNNLTTVYFNAVNCTSAGSYDMQIVLGMWSGNDGRAFGYCNNLTKVYFGNSVVNIPDRIFQDCSSLSSVTISEAVTAIGNAAFANCSSLQTVNFNAINCTKMGGDGNSSVFHFSAITTLNIGSNVKTIPDFAFSGCISLSYVNIPNSVTTIGDTAFGYCYSLSSVNISNGVKTISNYAFFNCSSLSSVNIPNSVTTIGWGAFMNCTSLTSVNIPNSVATIGWGAFEYCTSLTSVTIPNSITSIEESTFYQCSSLASVTIPEAVTTIYDSAFRECSSLKYITCNAISPPASFGSFVFYNVPTDIPVYVPCGSYIDYQNAPYWNSFTNFVDYCKDVTPAENSAVISWTAIDNAIYYEVTVYADESHTQVIGHYMIDAAGNVTKVRAENEQNDFSLSVEGLTVNTQYYYTITSYDSNDEEIVTFLGDFTTTANNGIENIAANQMNIYPNPAKDEIFIKSELPVKKIEIYSLTGALALSENNFNEKITVSTLPKGVYLLKVYTDKGLIIRKIVKD